MGVRVQTQSSPLKLTQIKAFKKILKKMTQEILQKYFIIF
jgi:hypothetical protein